MRRDRIDASFLNGFGLRESKAQEAGESSLHISLFDCECYRQISRDQFGAFLHSEVRQLLELRQGVI